MGGTGAWPKSSVQKLCPHFWHLWWGKAGVSTDPRVDKGWGRESGGNQRERETIAVCERERDGDREREK